MPGSGKTTVRNELKSRGYEAYDGDEDGLAKWYNDATGVVIRGRKAYAGIFAHPFTLAGPGVRGRNCKESI